MIARSLLLALTLLLSACGGDHVKGVLIPVAATVAGATPVDLLVATSRTYDDATGEFSASRGKTVSYQRLRLSIPPTHKPGAIEWPDVVPGNPETNFVSLANAQLDDAAFDAAVSAMVPPSGEVLVFVHGYNTDYEEGVFRFAQIVADSNIKTLPILFSWPSRGETKDYLTDRESTLASRNRLRQFLDRLGRHPRVKRFDIMAHSMGTFLTMETLVQAKLAGNPEFSGKLGTLILAAPDIDVDVFLTQFETIGRRPRPTVIMISRDDRALMLAQRLAGDVVRVGAASITARASVEAIKAYGFTVVDLTEVESTDSANHAKFAASPLVVQKLGIRLNDANALPGGQGVGAFVINATGAVLEAPSKVFDTVTQRR